MAIDIIGGSLADLMNTPENSQQQTKTPQIDGIFATFAYTALFNKPYAGHRIVEGQYTDEWVTFYNEREWRYIPALPKLSELGLRPFLTETEYNNSKLREACAYKVASNCRLGFQPNDIKYLVVRDDSEVVSFVGKLKSIKSQKYPPDDVTKVCTRLVPATHILSDF